MSYPGFTVRDAVAAHGFITAQEGIERLVATGADYKLAFRIAALAARYRCPTCDGNQAYVGIGKGEGLRFYLATFCRQCTDERIERELDASNVEFREQWKRSHLVATMPDGTTHDMGPVWP